MWNRKWFVNDICGCSKTEEHYTEKNIKLSYEKKQLLVDCMVKFSKLCDDNKLYYVIAFGTLLGSIRHKGLIPWDSHINLIMYLDDYDKIKSVLDKFGIQYGYKIYNEWKLSRIYIEDEIYIDIFFVQTLDNKIIRCGTSTEVPIAVVGRHIEKSAFDAYKTQLAPYRSNDEGLCFVPERDQDYWHKWFDFSADFVKDRILLPYEGHKFYAPKQWGNLLTYWYGAEYMNTCQTRYINGNNNANKVKDIKCELEKSN